tara:strand:- start:2288 stop:2770 length:483 start_codon:yes stop_codon:yes gene_type:complete
MIKFIIFLFLIAANSFALEIKCKFEEVYPNSSNQQGIFLIKNNKLRYEYYDNQLFTIFYNGKDFFSVRNNNKEIIQKINENNEILKELMILSHSYPNIENVIIKENLKIKLEKSEISKFYKRIAINSEKINISIYLNDCKFKSLSDKYFVFNPMKEYVDN